MHNDAVCATHTESFRESESQNKELNRSVQELTAIRGQLQSDRDAMEAEVQDSRDTIRDLQSRLDSATSVMNQLKVDLDNRLRERDEEIENLRSGLTYLLTYFGQSHNDTLISRRHLMYIASGGCFPFLTSN